MANYINSLVVNYKDTKQLKYGVNNICDNTTYYGSTTWSVINNGGITGLAVDGSQYTGVTLSENNAKYLVITNEYTGTTSDPVITVKASSDLVSCDTNNTCEITLKRACWRQPVIFELVINDDSKKYITSITGYNNLWWGKSSSSISIGYAGKISINDNNIENGICNYITTEDTTIHGNCNSALSSGDKIYFSFNNININASLKNNVQNVSVSGEVKYKFGDNTYTTLDSLSSDIYTYTSTSNSINITGCNYKTTQLHDLMDGFKTLYIKHIINLKYDDEVQEVQYKWYTSTDSGSTWSESTAYNITITVNNNFSGGEFVRVAYCTENRDDCADSYTIRNGNNITLDRTWELSDLRSSEINCAIFRTDSSLTTDLKNSSNGTYHISGDIVSSLGSNFPINVYYEVIEKTRIIEINIGLICDLVFVSENCDKFSGGGVDLEWEIKFNNIPYKHNDNYAAMPNGLNEVITTNIEIKGCDGIRPSGVILIRMPYGPILNKSSFTISVSKDGIGNKTFTGTSKNCPSGGIYYTYDNNLSLEVPFEVNNDGDEININIKFV